MHYVLKVLVTIYTLGAAVNVFLSTSPILSLRGLHDQNLKAYSIPCRYNQSQGAQSYVANSYPCVYESNY